MISAFVFAPSEATLLSLILVLPIIRLVSGIGLHASKLLKAITPESKIFLVARNLKKAHQAKEKVVDYCGSRASNENLIPMACDNTSLNSVREFCTALRKHLYHTKTRGGNSNGTNHNGIDVLCLNAAVLLGEDAKAEFTEDDIEVTFQTNHLAPFLMARLLYDLINPGGRVVVTSSGLHAFSSFQEFRGCQLGGKPTKRFEMINGEKFNHKQCYASTKLCNIAFCFALNRRLRLKNAKAVCFTPGLIPSSGLFRHQKNWMATAMKKQAVGMDDTVEWGGCMLAWMVLSERVVTNDPKAESTYWRAPLGISKRGGRIPEDLFQTPVNEAALERTSQELLWRLSSDLVGVQYQDDATISQPEHIIDQ